MNATDLFLRGFGVVYFLAFFSLWRELHALYMESGVAPIAESMERLKRAQYNFFKTPTLFWLGSSPWLIQGAVILGMVLSCFVLFNVLTAWSLLFLYLLYLSFVNVGAPFLNYQWDALLVESGFYAFLFSLSPQMEGPMTWVFWLLLFRLMFSSFIVKVQAYTPHWRSLKALEYHYESQPLPNSLAYFMHQLPKGFSIFTTLFVLLIEGMAPFLIFFGDFSRIIAFYIMVLFQWMIMLTGNYAFFNILMILISIPLLFKGAATPSTFAFVVGGLFCCFNLMSLCRLFYPFKDLTPLFNLLAKWGLVNNYGLFANMTKGRYEIVIEGSDDAEEWQEYEFFTKPQDTSKLPSQIAPLQPRVEWQLWFIPLVPWKHVGWFARLLEHLLKGTPAILSLFKTNPFDGAPPKHVRAVIYNYSFTDFKTWLKTGHAWERTYVGIYTPPITHKIGEADE